MGPGARSLRAAASDAREGGQLAQVAQHALERRESLKGTQAVGRHAPPPREGHVQGPVREQGRGAVAGAGSSSACMGGTEAASGQAGPCPDRQDVFFSSQEMQEEFQKAVLKGRGARSQ